MSDVTGPGMVPLEKFVDARLSAQAPTVDAEVLGAHRRILEAYRASRYGTMHRAGLQVAVKSLAGIWASHPDYDPTWRQ